MAYKAFSVTISLPLSRQVFDAAAISRITRLDAAYIFAHPKCDTLLPHVIDQRVDDLVIDKGQQAFIDFDQGHARAQRGKHTSIFTADHSAADHGQGFGQMIQLKQAIAGKNRLAIKQDVVGLGNGSPHRDHDIARRQLVFALFANKVHMNRMLIDNRSDAGEQFYAVALELMLADFDLVSNNMIGAQQQVVHGDIFFHLIRRAINRPLPKSRQMQDSFPQRLGWYGAGIDRYAADQRFLLDDGDPFSQLCRLDGGAMSGRSRANDDDIVIVTTGFDGWLFFAVADRLGVGNCFGHVTPRETARHCTQAYRRFISAGNLRSLRAGLPVVDRLLAPVDLQNLAGLDVRGL